jgi:hypothetical protein
MIIYKLKYKDKETAIADLIAKEVIDADLNYLQGTHAVVWIDKIILTDATFDADGNQLTEPIFADGYHVDIMVENEIDFPNAVEPNNPKHNFL